MPYEPTTTATAPTTEPATTPAPMPRYFVEAGGRLNFEARDDAAAIKIADGMPNVGQRGPDGHAALWRENAEPVTLAAASRGGVLPSP